MATIPFAAAQMHFGLVDNNARQPSALAAVVTKVSPILIGLDPRLLDYLFALGVTHNSAGHCQQVQVVLANHVAQLLVAQYSFVCHGVPLWGCSSHYTRQSLGEDAVSIASFVDLTPL